MQIAVASARYVNGRSALWLCVKEQEWWMSEDEGWNGRRVPMFNFYLIFRFCVGQYLVRMEVKKVNMVWKIAMFSWRSFVRF